MAQLGGYDPSAIGGTSGNFAGTGLNISAATDAYGISENLAVLPVITNNKAGQVKTKNYLEVLANYSKWSADQLGAVQKQLVAAGFLNSSPNSPVVYGQDSEDSLKAYESAVLMAARRGTTVGDILSSGAALRKSQGIGGDAGPAGSPINLTNPEDIKAVVSQVAGQLIGQTPDDNWINSFVKSFQSAQKKAGKAANAAKGGSTFTDAPSAQAAAAAAIKRDMPNKVKGFAEANNIDTARNLIDKTANNARL